MLLTYPVHTYYSRDMPTYYCRWVAKTHRMPYKLHVNFHKRATNYRALLRKMTCNDTQHCRWTVVAGTDLCWSRVAKTHRMPYKLQVIFHKRATNYRALLRKMTCNDTPHCRWTVVAGTDLCWCITKNSTPSCHVSSMYGHLTSVLCSRLLKIIGLCCKI